MIKLFKKDKKKQLKDKYKFIEKKLDVKKIKEEINYKSFSREKKKQFNKIIKLYEKIIKTIKSTFNKKVTQDINTIFDIQNYFNIFISDMIIGNYISKIYENHLPIKEFENNIIKAFNQNLVIENKLLENFNVVLSEAEDINNKNYLENLYLGYNDILFFFSKTIYHNITKIKEDINIEEFEKELFGNSIKMLEHSFLLYNYINETITIYINKGITFKELYQLLTIYQGYKFDNDKTKIVDIVIIENTTTFKQLLNYIKMYMTNDISIIKSLKTKSLKKYLLSSVAGIKIGDYSAYVWKEGDNITFSFSEVMLGNGYKLLDKNNITLNILDDFRTLGIELNGLTTLTDIIIGQIRYRISIIYNYNVIVVSIRQNTKGFKDKSIIRKYNFSEEDLIEENELLTINLNESLIKEEKIYNVEKENSFFPINSFLNRKEDLKVFENLALENFGGSIISGTTGHGKSSFLKTFTIFYFNFFLKEKNIRKKILFLEAPVETRYQDFYQIPYLLEKPEQLFKLVISSKTQNPQLTVIGETKDNKTLNEFYALTGLSQVYTTLHKGSVEEVIYYLNGSSKINQSSILEYLVNTNLIYCQHLVKDFNKLENQNVKTIINNTLSFKEIEKYFFEYFTFENDNNRKEAYEIILKLYNEKHLFSILNKAFNIKENNKDITKTDIINLYNGLDHKTKEKIDKVIKNDEVIKPQLKQLGKSAGIVNEFIDKSSILDFFNKEGTTDYIKLGEETKKIFFPLKDKFDENVFISKLTSNFYKYMKIQNYFQYKYFYYFMYGKLALNSNEKSLFTNKISEKSDNFKLEILKFFKNDKGMIL